MMPAIQTSLVGPAESPQQAMPMTVLHGLDEQGAWQKQWRPLAERQVLDTFYCLMDGLYSERYLYSRMEYERRLESIWPIH
jgi:hypothetical protein